MRSTRTITGLATLALIAAPLLAQQGAGRGQQPPPQPRTPPTQAPRAGQAQDAAQQRTHQQLMTQMQTTVQRMQQLHERARLLADGLRQRTQAQLQERDRLMLGTCDGLEQQARQMQQTATRAEEMIRSRDFQRDRDMQRDMDRLRQRLDNMANEMDESLKIMERLRDRTRTSAP